MILVSQLRHQFAEHVAAAGEAMQQQDGGFVFRPCLTIKDIAVFNLNFVIRRHILNKYFLYYSQAFVSTANLRKICHIAIDMAEDLSFISDYLSVRKYLSDCEEPSI